DKNMYKSLYEAGTAVCNELKEREEKLTAEKELTKERLSGKEVEVYKATQLLEEAILKK
ncbi:unnamed protein product, partial [Didymodactylos carnosus]